MHTRALTEIRTARPDQVALVAALGRRTFHDAFADRNPAADLKQYLDAAFDAERIAEELRDPASTFLLGYFAEPADDPELAAFRDRPFGYTKLRRARTQFSKSANQIELQRMYVEAALHGRGLGSVLIEASLQHARAGGHDSIWLCTWDINDDANRFYRRHGFVEIGEQEFVLGSQHQRDLVMERAL